MDPGWDRWKEWLSLFSIPVTLFLVRSLWVRKLKGQVEVPSKGPRTPTSRGVHTLRGRGTEVPSPTCSLRQTFLTRLTLGGTTSYLDLTLLVHPFGSRILGGKYENETRMVGIPTWIYSITIWFFSTMSWGPIVMSSSIVGPRTSRLLSPIEGLGSIFSSGGCTRGQKPSPGLGWGLLGVPPSVSISPEEVRRGRVTLELSLEVTG